MSLDRGTIGRLSVQRLSKRFSRNKDYDRVDDTTDTRVPLYNEEAFQHGLSFKAKYIGSLQINKPSSKLDIITAMRRIRYEFKVKGVKKQRCTIDVSTQGVKVMKRKRRRRKQYTEDQLFIMHHPIYRIFYVSHDSQDLKIFSYITREVPNNSFRCNVFKAYRKRMALHLVRSLGQAFDVCHKLNPRPKKKRAVLNEDKKSDETNNEENKHEDEVSLENKNKTGDTEATTELPNTTEDDSVEDKNSKIDYELPPLIDLDPLVAMKLPPIPAISAQPLSTYVGRPRPRPGQNSIQENPMISSTDSIKRTSPSLSIGEPLTEIDASEKSWEIERQQMKAQMTLLTEQLHSETAARIESQARVEHLLMQNKELLSHLQKLMVQLQQLQSLQMSQIASQPTKVSTPNQVNNAGLTPPNTDQSEPSSSETQLTNSSPETTRNEAKPFDEQPLISEESTKVIDNHSSADQPNTYNSQDSHDKANLDDAFTTQVSNEEVSLIDAAFLPQQDQAKQLDAAFTISVTS